MEMNPSTPNNSAFARLRERITTHNRTVAQAILVAERELDAQQEREKEELMKQLNKKFIKLKQEKTNQTTAFFAPMRSLLIEEYNHLTKLQGTTHNQIKHCNVFMRFCLGD